MTADGKKTAAVVLAAGSGKRMGRNTCNSQEEKECP